MKKFTIIVTIILFLSGVAWAETDYSDKPIIDEDFKKIELEINSVTTECIKNAKYAGEWMECGNDLTKKYRKQGKLRGTEEYCRRHYAKLPLSELRKIWKDLRLQRLKARISPDEIVPGEVTETLFMIEQFWVESKLARTRKQRVDEVEKSLKYIDLNKPKK